MSKELLAILQQSELVNLDKLEFDYHDVSWELRVDENMILLFANEYYFLRLHAVFDSLPSCEQLFNTMESNNHGFLCFLHWKWRDIYHKSQKVKLSLETTCISAFNSITYEYIFGTAFDQIWDAIYHIATVWLNCLAINENTFRHCDVEFWIDFTKNARTCTILEEETICSTSTYRKIDGIAHCFDNLDVFDPLVEDIVHKIFNRIIGKYAMCQLPN